MQAVSTVPANADPLAHGPRRYRLAHLGDRSDNFVPWNARIGEAGEGSLLDDRVASTHAASVDLDQDFADSRHRNGPFHDFKVAACR